MTIALHQLTGECADMLRARQTPALAALGPPSTWPPPLLWATELMLGANEAMFCAFGPERRMLYNDKYIAILGERHPAAMGAPMSEVWYDIWDDRAQALVERAFAGESIVVDEIERHLLRGGRRTETHFSFGYHPIRDAQGFVFGFLCVCRETTQRVLQRKQREAELARQWRLLDQAPSFMAVLAGTDYRLEFTNQAYQTAFGPRPMAGRPLAEVFPEAAQQGFIALLDQVRASGERHVGTRTPVVLNPGGPQEATHIVDVIYEPLFDDDGNVTNIFVLGNDVTELVRSQAGERAGNERYATLLDSMSEGFVMLDRAFCMTTINREAERLAQRPAAELLGRSYLELWPDMGDSSIERACREVMAGAPAQQLEYRYRSPLGDVWLDVRIFPVESGIALAYHDVSAVKRAQQVLVLSEERFRAAVSAVGVMWTTDIHGRMRGDQPGWRSLTGQTEAQYGGYGWLEAVHPEDAAPTRAAWDHAIAQRRPFDFEHRVRQLSGGWRRYAVRAVPALNADGSIREWVGMHIDVTESRAAAQALLEADRRKDHFLATLSHELRNPLAAILHAAQVLEQDTDSPQAVQAVASVIRRQSRHMAGLLDELLDLARITTGSIELKPAPVPLGEVLAQAKESVRAAIDTRGHDLRVKVSSEDARRTLMIDARRIVQVISNLLANAACYTPNGGHIDLHARIADDGLHVEVRDDGIGIEATSLPGLFDFQRLPASMAQAQIQGEPGLGLGLALSHELVQLHDGRIEAYSDGPGRGTTISMWIPQPASGSTDLPAAVDGPPPQPASGTRSEARSILVVDDNADAAASLALLLQMEGHRVDVAMDAPSALVQVSTRPAQIGILDIGLPGTDGYELARQLRALPGGNGMLLLAATGWGQRQDRERALASGFDHHFTKPIDVEVLLAVISNWEPPGNAERL